MPLCNLATCSCHLQFATHCSAAANKSDALHHGPSHFPQSFPTPPSFRAPRLWLGGFWVVLASPALLPLALALVVLSCLGHSGGCRPSLAVLWASLVWINTHVLSTFSSLICSLKPESSGWLWTDMHMLWVLTHLLWATCFVPSLALKQQYHLHSFS